MKESSEILLKYIDTEIAPKVPQDLKLEIVVQSLLQAGCKSFSHLLNTIERSIGLLNVLVKTSAQRHLVIEGVANFWSKSAQHIIILLDKLMTYKVIDGSSIVNWLFDHERVNSFHSYVWEILSNTVNKTLARCETLKRELHAAIDSGTDKVRALEQAIEQAQREHKELFIVIFQRFATVVAEYLQSHPPEGIWYRTILGYFKAIGRRYIEEIRPFIGMLDTLLFANAEPSSGTLTTFDQLKLMCGTPVLQKE
jgi:nuclear cap-binding protein subunit 1